MNEPFWLYALATPLRESPETRVFAPKLAFVPGSSARMILLRDITELANRSEFMRVVAHDLRQPLTSLKGYASILEAQFTDAENPLAARQAAKILSAVEKLNAQIEHFQDADRFDPVTGFYEMKRALCDVREILTRVVNTYLVPTDKPELVISVAIAVPKPPPTGLRRWPSVRRTSSKNTSFTWSWPAAASFIGRTVTPGACISTQKKVSPLCLGTVGSLRAMMTP